MNLTPVNELNKIEVQSRIDAIMDAWRLMSRNASQWASKNSNGPSDSHNQCACQECDDGRPDTRQIMTEPLNTYFQQLHGRLKELS